MRDLKKGHRFLSFSDMMSCCGTDFVSPSSVAFAPREVPVSTTGQVSVHVPAGGMPGGTVRITAATTSGMMVMVARVAQKATGAEIFKHEPREAR